MRPKRIKPDRRVDFKLTVPSRGASSSLSMQRMPRPNLPAKRLRSGSAGAAAFRSRIRSLRSSHQSGIGSFDEVPDLIVGSIGHFGKHRSRRQSGESALDKLENSR
jgi:hypothetical protein